MCRVEAGEPLATQSVALWPVGVPGLSILPYFAGHQFLTCFETHLGFPGLQVAGRDWAFQAMEAITFKEGQAGGKSGRSPHTVGL